MRSAVPVAKRASATGRAAEPAGKDSVARSEVPPMPLVPSVRRPIITAIALGFLFPLSNGCRGPAKAPAPPPPTVVVATVVQQDTPIYSEWVATLDGFVNAQIQPLVAGYVIKQNYTEGSLVKRG